MNPTTRNHSGGGISRRRRFSNTNAPARRSFSRSRPQRHAGRPSRPARGGRHGSSSFDPSRFINTNPVDASPEIYTPVHTFRDFGLDTQLVDTVASLNIASPSPIQDKIIPEILNGRDVIGMAETGTGKTAAFLLPLIHKTKNDPRRQTLILAPTRELAQQIDNDLRKLSRASRMFSVICVGGTNINPQIRALRKQNHFVIGTPGRVLDLIKRGAFKPAYITTVVLDEADRMLDMGFINDIRSILSETPRERETLFFSATMSADAKRLVNDFLRDPITVSVKKKDVTNSIEQDIVRYSPATKFDTLTTLFADADLKRVLIFGAMKHSVEKLAKQLSQAGISAESIHGNKSQGQRERALAKFKSGNARVLVATDVAARGIHVENISHVINYDLPNTFEDYVHRIGRTGRGSNRGKALTFVAKS